MLVLVLVGFDLLMLKLSLLKLVVSWLLVFFFSSRRRHTRLVSDWSSDVCSSDLDHLVVALPERDLAGRIRPLEPLDARFRVVQQRRLLTRNLEVGHADRDTAHGEIGRASCRERV